jgi:hypothetical protein
MIGIPLERPPACKSSSRSILRARSNVMVIPPTIVLLVCGPKKANHPGVALLLGKEEHG